jgi:hypothetical protein
MCALRVSIDWFAQRAATAEGRHSNHGAHGAWAHGPRHRRLACLRSEKRVLPWRLPAAGPPRSWAGASPAQPQLGGAGAGEGSWSHVEGDPQLRVSIARAPSSSADAALEVAGAIAPAKSLVAAAEALVTASHHRIGNTCSQGVCGTRDMHPNSCRGTVPAGHGRQSHLPPLFSP